MDAERLILETDAAGNLKQVPKLPANKQLEVVFWVIADVESLSPSLPQSSVSSIEAMVDNHGDWQRRRAVVQKINDLWLRLKTSMVSFQTRLKCCVMIGSVRVEGCSC